MLAAATRANGSTPQVQVTLVGTFGVTTSEGAVDLPHSAQRLIAFLALEPRPLPRLQVAGTLWPDVSEERAAGSLRSALWLSRQAGQDAVLSRRTQLELARPVEVDLHQLVAVAHRLQGDEPVSDMHELATTFDRDLLPDWYDDWVVVWRERWRHLRLHALEALASRLASIGAFTLGVEAGLAAVRAEPLRESAHRALIRVHLSEGNGQEAVRQYQAYRQLLHEEMQLEPSPLMEALVAGWSPG